MKSDLLHYRLLTREEWNRVSDRVSGLHVLHSHPMTIPGMIECPTCEQDDFHHCESCHDELFVMGLDLEYCFIGVI